MSRRIIRAGDPPFNVGLIANVVNGRRKVAATLMGGRGADQIEARFEDAAMPLVTTVYWRDIPAQVIVGQGRRAEKRQLPERFEQAIDRCAMKVGARDSDAYLAEWRRGAPVEVEGAAAEIAAREAARLDATFDAAALRALIEAEGWARDPAAAQDG